MHYSHSCSYSCSLSKPHTRFNGEFCIHWRDVLLYDFGLWLESWSKKESGFNEGVLAQASSKTSDPNVSGETVEGKWKPSSDTKTHLALYKKYSQIKGIVHTHSTNAVAFAQAGMKIPALGTTHADYFYGDIPCTRELSKEEVMEAYELNTGKVIIETIEKMNYDPMAIPGIVVKNHGPFAWGSSPANAVYNAVVMENVAEMDIKTLLLNSQAEMKQYVLDKHYMRKHGPNAYYGQK